MALGYAIHQILTAGTTDALVKDIRVGNLKERELYPVVQINDFSTPEHCKDGYSEAYTLTVITWAATQKECESVSAAVIADVHGLAANTYSGVDILWSRFDLRGPWLRDETKKYWGRPIDFEIRVSP